ncbi:YceI family protein [Ideonella azotifigens]|uniref:YceI family protein n=1 Tax=Ideonella azotifigens TaxID=513160 RepID=A0ABN1JL72_9BURK|nr:MULTISPECIES: YceI family protein [Ideonella]MCD2339663.1 YceI family protein [Ideonella azotifigens]HSI50713.1 YceI family protein [Ideonella sp.]
MKTALIAAAIALLASTAAQAESATYAIDPAHTYATFEITHFGTSTNRARFDKKEGSVTLDKAAKTGKVDLTIDMSSVNSGFEAFNKHLKSAEIFNAEAFPTAKFVGDKFTFAGDKVTEIGGSLTLLGKTNPVTLKATNFNCYVNPMNKREVCGGDFETTVTRSQFGVNYGLNYGFPDAVRVVIQVEAVKQ